MTAATGAAATSEALLIIKTLNVQVDAQFTSFTPANYHDEFDWADTSNDGLLDANEWSVWMLAKFHESYTNL